jgi:hypothetical protein
MSRFLLDTRIAHPDYAQMAAAGAGASTNLLLPWALRATTRAYRLELGGWGGWGAWSKQDYAPVSVGGRRAPSIIIAGAGVGTDALHFLRMFSAAVVTAVEPDAATAAALSANLGLRARFARRARVVCGSAAEYLESLAGPHEAGRAADLVFFPAPPAGKMVAAARRAAPLVVIRAPYREAAKITEVLKNVGAAVTRHPIRNGPYYELIFARFDPATQPIGASPAQALPAPVGGK